MPASRLTACLKNSFSQDEKKSPDARTAKCRGMRRRYKFVAVTRDEQNAANLCFFNSQLRNCGGGLMGYWLFAFLWSFLTAVLFCTPAFAESKQVFGSFSYTYGDNETTSQAKEICRTNAARSALESALVYIKSEARVDLSGVQAIDIDSQASGCLRDIIIVEEKVDGRTVTCKLQAVVDLAELERTTMHFKEPGDTVSNRTVKFAFHSAKIAENLDYSKDGSNPAPDSYILITDRHGNAVFHTGVNFLNNMKYIQLIKNRNNYNPSFDGVGFTYTFRDGDYLVLRIMDWDGLEGFMGRKKSPDDPIGSEYGMFGSQALGKRTIIGRGWELELECMPVTQ